jgi:trehalose/maltose hydrolase-like predicted phosphorylase
MSTARGRRAPSTVRTLAAAIVIGCIVGPIAIAAPPTYASTVYATSANTSGGSGSYLLTATNTGATYAPTFTGNGELGIRVPPAGQGYAGGAVPAQSELAGFYAQPPGGVQQRANLPTWSTLTFSDGGQPFSLATGTTRQWHQSINLRTGVITTNALWMAPDGHVTGLTYQVLTDRARPHVGVVHLQLTPRWSGVATVTDAIDGSPADLSTEEGKGWSSSAHSDWVDIQAMGTGIGVAMASRIEGSGNVKATATRVDQEADQSVGQQLTFPVSAGHTYLLTKFVGVESSQDTGTPTAAAQDQASGAAAAGFAALMAANDAAWAAIWSGRIDVLGDPGLATDVNASEFYLWSSVRDGVDWSISPSGLSSNGYNGHVFWDADTWMYPALLAQHPDLAAAMVTYRFQRLGAAEQHATATGYSGARYPWESAITGSEQIPPPSSLFTEGLYEQHITSDVALAQWQYYLATGQKGWLAQYGWPVLSQAAAFWASRVTLDADGSYHIDGVTGPDEEHPDVNDEAYTNVAAKSILVDATHAARVLGVGAPSSWDSIASRIVVPVDPNTGIVPEFSGYNGELIKQADVTMLEFPWGYGLPAGVAENDINYYAARTDPDGPSMSDAVNSIGTSALGVPGCASFVYTQRSLQPFIRDVFDQFSETSSGGAFTFMTGIGGFLQEFLYGYSGLRLGTNAVQLSPSLTGQVGGVVLHDLSWHGRRFTVAIGQKTTSVTVAGGGDLPVATGAGMHQVATGQTLTVPTRRPDLAPTSDDVRCGSATATSTEPGSPALAAVDGSPATGWQPQSVPATLVAPVAGGPRSVTTVTLQWGQQWPEPTVPDQTPPPGPPTTLRPTHYVVSTSVDGHHWHPVGQVEGGATGTTDVLKLAPAEARYISVQILASTGGLTPRLAELTVN